MEQTGDTDAKLPRLAPQPCGQLGRQRQLGLVHVAAIALHIAEVERQGRLIDIGKLFAEEPLMLGRADAQARLGHIVAIRHRGGHRRRAVQEADQLFADHLQGRVVEDDVVELQGGFDLLGARHLTMQQTDQRRLAQVQAARACIEVQQLQWRMAPDHLHGLWKAIPEHGGTQHIMAGDDLVQRAGEGLQALQAGKAQP
ncbi:hypothetical protein D3C76_246850 [compost metagenome]